jgi:Cof subfamily protein (haloacid dehalogenase superfamily)
VRTQRIRLLALDIDGTLLTTGNVLSPAVVSAAREALDRGCRAVLLTGRSLASTTPVAAQFPDGFVVGLGTYDGARLEWYPSGEVLRDVRLEPEVAARTLEIMYRYGLGPSVFPGDANGGPVYGSLEHPPPEMWQGLNLDRMRLLDEPEMLAALAERVVTISALADHDTAFACYEELRETLGQNASVIITLSERYGGHFAQVAGPLATKAAALVCLAERLDVPLGEILAMGDWMNDRAMLELAGVGVAMAGSPDDVLAAADWVTGSVADDGAARAIERFVLAP